MKLTGEDLSCYSNKIESVSLRKCNNMAGNGILGDGGANGCRVRSGSHSRLEKSLGRG